MCMRDVLGVLEDDGDSLWSTFRATVALAAEERARLTLAKTRWSPRSFVWCAPFAMGGAYLPPEEDPEVTCTGLLARAAEFVPQDIPVTTLLLGVETERELRRLVCTDAYDALVAPAGTLHHARRLRRDCTRHDVQVIDVAVSADAGPESALGADTAEFTPELAELPGHPAPTSPPRRG